MQYSQEVENMCPVAKVHTTAPHPSPRRQVVQAKEISDISGLTHVVWLVRTSAAPASSR